MEEFVANLSNSANRPVLDKTGLPGRYTFRVTLRDTSGGSAGEPDTASPWDLEKLGFKLVPMTAPLPLLIIDYIEKPTEN